VSTSSSAPPENEQSSRRVTTPAGSPSSRTFSSWSSKNRPFWEHDRLFDHAVLLVAPAVPREVEDETIVGRGALQEPVETALERVSRRLGVLEHANVVEAVRRLERRRERVGVPRRARKVVRRTVRVDTDH
jgi:hypothetical protein